MFGWLVARWRAFWGEHRTVQGWIEADIEERAKAIRQEYYTQRNISHIPVQVSTWETLDPEMKEAYREQARREFYGEGR